MRLTEEQKTELLSAAEPLMKFISDHGHPHIKIVVDIASAEMLEGVAAIQYKTDSEEQEG